MKMFSEQELQQISQTIGNIEQQTDAELMAVIATASDDYYFVPTLWAAIIALFTPALLYLSPLWLDITDLLMAQLAVFVALTLLFRVPAIKYRMIPKSVKYRRASLLAHQQFLFNGIHKTQQHLGMIIFVSEADHYVEIITDYGISQQIDNQVWQKLVQDFTQNVKQGNTYQGYIQCLTASGEVLAQHFPLTQQKNELPNALVVID
ncbi:TPM domain-containing protein [Photobacterium damselae]|uniref:TPM domain-containing protein n=1 Tax=Photobacterium damselae TaxID=38293 RepID=UPI0012AE8D9E|nr:TPM domain-containing protein [Photobacterium damselae]